MRVTDQLSADQNQKGISSSAPSRCSVPQCDQQASVLQKMERKRKCLPKENITNENNRESLNLTGSHVSCNNSSAKTSKLVILEEDASDVKTYLNSRHSEAFTTDFCDIRHLDALEQSQLIETLKQAATVVVTLMYEDGSTQLRADQALVSSVKGIVMLLRSHPEEGSSPLAAPASDSVPEDMPSDQCIYIKTKHSPIWVQEQEARHQFAKNVLLEVLKCKRPVICFNAKDFVRTALQLFGDDGSWKCVADFVGLDPRIAAWLIDPTDTAPSFEDLVAKYLGNPTTLTVNSTDGNSSRRTVNQTVRANLRVLHRLTMHLCSQLQARRFVVASLPRGRPLSRPTGATSPRAGDGNLGVCGLWQLFRTLELPLIPILAEDAACAAPWSRRTLTSGSRGSPSELPVLQVPRPRGERPPDSRAPENNSGEGACLEVSPSSPHCPAGRLGEQSLQTALEPSGRAASPPAVSPHPPPLLLGSRADPGGHCGARTVLMVCVGEGGLLLALQSFSEMTRCCCQLASVVSDSNAVQTVSALVFESQ
ncbi:DNA polymerase nu [Oryx dammah]|uniref:DNA polymerase nu n=1 Tax=Oryx dammah TaxID=59534 RepID=UPI001A9A94D3|nr:DNA polymerase nu [Oryx dammah]